MYDVAAERDERGISIRRVGVRDIHLPVMIREKGGGHARVVGVFDASVELPQHERGTHMSRFVQLLSRWSRRTVAMPEMEAMLGEIRGEFDAQAARLRLGFTYFLQKPSPATGELCQLDYECCFCAQYDNGAHDFLVGADVPIITLCPCSKQIADRGAHSQRAVIRVRLRTIDQAIVWLEDLIPLLEAQGSAQIYPVLKRQDEKLVTEQAYDNPKFVEDVVRDTVLALRELPEAAWFSVECESFESIHNHSAYAYTEYAREGPPAAPGASSEKAGLSHGVVP
jgi:GTP cyclohydrolase I